MDQESAKLISILYTRAEVIPYLMPMLMLVGIVSLVTLVMLVKLWMPQKKSPSNTTEEVESSDDIKPVENKNRQQAA